MARWENEDLTGLNLPEPCPIIKTFFDKNGKETEDQDLALAKTSQMGDRINYYIKYNRGEIIDPHHTDYNNVRKNSNATFKKVNKKTFDTYSRFLKTKNVLYFTMARRMVMEQL